MPLQAPGLRARPAFAARAPARRPVAPARGSGPVPPAQARQTAVPFSRREPDAAQAAAEAGAAAAAPPWPVRAPVWPAAPRVATPAPGWIPRSSAARTAPARAGRAKPAAPARAGAAGRYLGPRSQGPPDPLRGAWHLDVLHALLGQGVEHRVHHRGRCADGAQFAAALDPEQVR